MYDAWKKALQNFGLEVWTEEARNWYEGGERIELAEGRINSLQGELLWIL